ncbi:MAG: prepilin-type N-terminal cleavage/methylation domain-containing protein [Alphaproteobacteria bacterium]|nr:prepilin-type N-terminal cleavage/methylation domain-containing protein [Alphaproteobacteria bacterium]
MGGRPYRGRKKGFTLVELMIVVAIIGLLAAIAIPNFRQMQLRSKRTEALSNVDGIRTAQFAYMVNSPDGEPLHIGTLAPDPNPGVHKRAFGHNAGFEALGFRPEGGVRCSYQSLTFSSKSAHQVQALCDLDGDGERIVIVRDLILGTNYQGSAASSPDICVIAAGGPFGIRFFVVTDAECFSAIKDANDVY